MRLRFPEYGCRYPFISTMWYLPFEWMHITTCPLHAMGYFSLDLSITPERGGEGTIPE